MKMQIKPLLRNLLLAGFALLASPAFADYPVVTYRYLADPAAIECDGRMYVYMANDDENPLTEPGSYDMKSIVCVSTADMKNWTDHGIVFEVPRDASWAGRTWAPTAITRDGKVFLYYANGGGNIGVAVADKPTGPFRDPLGKAIVSGETPGVLPAEGIWIFDPMVFIDDDGQAYMYFGGNGDDNIRVVKLKRDMITVDGSAMKMSAPNFFEAAWMHKRNGIYYFSYSTTPKADMRIDYMTSKSPTSGFKYAGIVAQPPPENYNNNHHSILKFKDKWYHVYHNRSRAMKNGHPMPFKRNLAVEVLSYEKDGRIKTIEYTKDGVPQIQAFNPYVQTPAATMSAQEGISVRGDDLAVMGGKDGAWFKISGVDFGAAGAKKLRVRAESPNGPSTLEVRLNEPNGPTVAKIPVGRKNETFTVPVSIAKGEHDLFFVMPDCESKGGSSLAINAWQFVK